MNHSGLSGGSCAAAAAPKDIQQHCISLCCLWEGLYLQTECDEHVIVLELVLQARSFAAVPVAVGDSRSWYVTVSSSPPATALWDSNHAAGNEARRKKR